MRFCDQCAIDEIERLTVERDEWRAKAKAGAAAIRMLREKTRAEIDRLTAAITDEAEKRHGSSGACCLLRLAEKERADRLQAIIDRQPKGTEHAIYPDRETVSTSYESVHQTRIDEAVRYVGVVHGGQRYEAMLLTQEARGQ